MNNESLADLLKLGDWRAAMLSVPRDAFVPDAALACPEDSDPYPIDWQARPEEWQGAVFSDTAIITQRADGQGDPADASAGDASSSLSAPGVAFDFLTLMSPVAAGDRILEIGTGTGYTAAVLAAQAGQDNVTSIEVDPDVAARAIANLKTAGVAPHVIVGDGAAGCPEHGPFDRIHVTCAVAAIPHAWVEQTVHGGVIVAPWQPSRGDGFRVRLTRSGRAAYGRFHGRCSYMMLRSDRADVTWRAHHTDEANVTTTMVDPRAVARAGDGLTLLTTAVAPKVRMFRIANDDGSFSLLLFEVGRPGGSWAACDYEPGRDKSQVTQYGKRRLWEEMHSAWLRWQALGEPDANRFGLTVTAQGQQLWLDQPQWTIGTV
jgi:protein-L-isoaspartate(D-aspartate) O-methyltransferase